MSNKKLPEFSINDVKFTDNDCKYIKNKIIERYEKSCPGKQFNVIYKKVKNEYSFLVYKNEVIIDNNGELQNEDIFIHQYSNSIVINVFTMEMKEKFYKKYYDDQKIDINEITDYLDSIVTIYALQNVKIEWEINKRDKYVIMREILQYEQHMFFMNRIMEFFYFKYNDCCTKNELSDLKRRVNKFMKKIDKKYLK